MELTNIQQQYGVRSVRVYVCEEGLIVTAEEDKRETGGLPGIMRYRDDKHRDRVMLSTLSPGPARGGAASGSQLGASWHVLAEAH